MNTITVWLLVLTGHFNGGEWMQVQPHNFPTAAACEQVGKNKPKVMDRSGYSYTADVGWRCIQTEVVR
jgi:hypothetical protein